MTVDEIIHRCGGRRQMAEQLGVSVRTVDQWRYRGFPKDRVLCISRNGILFLERLHEAISDRAKVSKRRVKFATNKETN